MLFEEIAWREGVESRSSDRFRDCNSPSHGKSEFAVALYSILLLINTLNKEEISRYLSMSKHFDSKLFYELFYAIEIPCF